MNDTPRILHPDWHADGIEDGRDLWRLDLPEIQIQASINVTNIAEEEDGSPPEYGTDAKIFIEHDVRGGGDTGDDRTKYSCDEFKSHPEELFSLLAMGAVDVANRLGKEIRSVRVMESDPRMCGPTKGGKAYWCVTRDDGDGFDATPRYKAHGPYDTDEAAWAFDDAIDFVCSSELSSLGVFQAESPDEAVKQAEAVEVEAGKGE